MKKLNITFLLILFMSIMSTKAFAYDIAVENSDGVTIYYRWYNNHTELEVTKWEYAGQEYTGNVVIPEIVNYDGEDYRVTSIGDMAFLQCKKLNSVSIPNSVTSIGYRAFCGCSELNSISIPTGISYIGDDAFMETPWYNAKPDGMVYIGKVAYKYKGTMPSNTNVVIKEGTLCISGCAFQYCTGLNNVQIPNSVSSIGDFCFDGCSNLALVSIPDGVVSIGRWAFMNCSNLSSITVSNTVSSIGEQCFFGCSALTSFSIPESITVIHSWTFKDCVSLASVFIPNSVVSIEFEAFVGCVNLYTLSVPSSVINIGENAFGGTPWYDSLPDGLLYLGKVAFSYKGAMPENTGIEIKEGTVSISERAFQGFAELSTVLLPNTLIEIGDHAFEDCINLKSLIIPNSVEKMRQAFNGCNSLSSITVPSRLKTYLGLGCPSLMEVKSYLEYPERTEAAEWLYKAGFHPNTYTNGILYVPEGTKEKYMNLDGWNDFATIEEFVLPVHTLSYILDGEPYASYQLKEGETIIPEPSPEKEGCSFSGWEGLPIVMLDHDVSVSGSLTVNKYKLTYIVDEEVYTSLEMEYGAIITPEPDLFKEGYTFSGWIGLPETMPAHDVTVTGSFTPNKYKLTYLVDGAEYKSYEVEYMTPITPEPAPTKVGYTFSGWAGLPETMPAHDVTVTGTFSINTYTLTYIVDGEVYASYVKQYGASITQEPVPVKEGYTFSGWSAIPATMPAHDVTVTGYFTPNKYKLVYVVDGEEYKSYEVEFKASIIPEPAPEKEGYSFSGWEGLPETMPAHDVTVTGSFSINTYTLTYIVDGEEYASYEMQYGSNIIPEPVPVREGYTFSGWSAIPATMPARDVTVTGTFSINSYVLTYMIDETVYKTVEYEYGATITPEPVPEGNYVTFEWVGEPETMPAHDVIVHASYETSIADLVVLARMGAVRIFTPNGKQIDCPQKGLNIVVMQNGNVKKVVVK